MNRIVGNSFLVLVMLAASSAHAQTVEGQATGSVVSVLGVELSRTSDTGQQTATAGTADDEFDQPASGEALNASPIIEVNTGSSRTTGMADDAPAEDNTSFVTSTAGDAVAVIGDGLVEAVTNGSEVTLACGAAPVQTSSVTTLRIAGQDVVTFPADSPTTIISDALPLIKANTRVCDTQTLTDLSCTSQALRVQLVQDGELVDVALSSTSGALRDMPEGCICPDPSSPLCFPCRNFTASDIDGSFLEDIGCPGDDDPNGAPNASDVIELAVEVVNSSADTCEALDVTLLNRIPQSLDIDETTVEVDGTPVAGTIANCPAGVAFNGCTGETPINTDRRCLSVPLGLIGPGESVTVTYRGEVTAKDEICNTVLLRAPIGGSEVTLNELTAVFPDGDCVGLGGDILKTTGSGGCAVSATAAPASSESWPVGLLVAALLWRGARRRRAR